MWCQRSQRCPKPAGFRVPRAPCPWEHDQGHRSQRLAHIQCQEDSGSTPSPPAVGASPAMTGRMRVSRGALATSGWKVAAGDGDLHPSIHRARRGQRLRAFLIAEGCAQPRSACSTTGFFLPGKLPTSGVPKSPDLVCGGAQVPAPPSCPGGEEMALALSKLFC